eukprot:4007644-Pleurochrysis_carterae.AAC.1
MTGWATAAAPPLAQTRHRALHSIRGSGRRRTRELQKPTRARRKSAQLSKRPTRVTTQNLGWSATGWRRTWRPL